MSQDFDAADQLFQICDLDGSGYVDEAELAQICKELPAEDLHEIFLELDKDQDGHISVEEFRRGFKEIYNNVKKRRLSSKTGDERAPQSCSVDDGVLDEFVGSLDDGLKALSCQEQVCDLYQQLHASDQSDLLQNFESIILGVLKDVRFYQLENERLEKSFKREKEQQERHLRELEDEMDKEIQKLEEAFKAKEEERIATEKAELRKEVDNEIKTLQQNLTKLQEDKSDPRGSELEEQVNNVKLKLDELTVENRRLRSELTDAQTNLALVRSELATVRQQHKDKCQELSMEKQTVMDYIKEQDNLTRQLHLLHDANKQLHDTNDDLRLAIESRRQGHRPSVASATSSTPNTCGKDRRGSVMSEYFLGHRSGTPSIRSCNLSPASSVVEEPISRQLSVSNSSYSPRHFPGRLPRDETCEEDNIADDLDSGHSTLREHNDLDTESEAHYDDDLYRHRMFTPKPPANRLVEETDEPESHDETEAESVFPNDNRALQLQTRLGAPSIRSSRASLRSRESRNSRLRRMTASQESIGSSKASRDPERMYKIVLAGDAAVGKSSFIMRLCKGKFVPNLSSTLGVDFQTKVLEVDGRTIALQLWDTAGQERFRSIAKSYFRRADGVLLLYDCSYERSFMSVREWVDSIEEGAQKKVPIMLCGNKSDLREEAEKQGRKVVNFEEGQRLAREFEGLFIETSAKEGSNIVDAVTELSRLLASNEDLEVEASGLQLHDPNYDPSKRINCCGRSS
ncbi:ras and EF-hand domain-containing protein homolog isoform X1 [Magallana gigas]|uniref:ras and EF-hand domain-containing protein homolog isoform X1 n=1 Tax=Magallana gigas TaxID=29159 RepID=UPI0005C35A1B|eukprot:XP_011448289.1 PREDICTED: ras and EF-hand domain-containing protein homolog isoform X1 [Crassostrea gigas]